MPDNADERVIAEWYSHRFHDSATASDEERILDGDFFTGSKGEVYLALPANESIRWSPSTDANLWPGIMKKVYKDKQIVCDFERLLEFCVVGIANAEMNPYYRTLAAIKAGPEAWTRALAQAIREMKGGG